MGRITDAITKKEDSNMDTPTVGARVRYFANSRDHAARPNCRPFEPVPATVTAVNGNRVDLEVELVLDVLDKGALNTQTGVVVRNNVPHLSESVEDFQNTGERESHWDYA